MHSRSCVCVSVFVGMSRMVYIYVDTCIFVHAYVYVLCGSALFVGLLVIYVFS